MSLRSKILAAAATLTLAGTLGAASGMTATAATPSCGPTCIDIFNKKFGTFGHPAFVLDVFRQGARAGQPLILFRQSNADPAEDFTVAVEGKVSDFYAAGLVSNTLALHYGCNTAGFLAGADNTIPCATNPLTGRPSSVNAWAFETEYAPYGVDSGLCVGVAATAFQNEGVTLQPCGVSSKTVWAVDTLDSCPISNPLYFLEAPVINGSDTNFSHPYVLTYPANGFPTDKPRPQLMTTSLTGFSQTGNTISCGGGAIVGPDDDQLFAAVAGVLH